MHTHYRWAISAFACVLGSALLSSPVAVEARAYPAKPIRLIVGFPPGGVNDTVARTLAPKLSEIIGARVVVENRPGANATIATGFVAKSAPDGYVVTMASASSLVISPHTYAKLPYNTVRDLSAVTTIVMTPEVLAVHPALPVRNLATIIALAKIHPGKLDIASSGRGGLPHLAIELFQAQAKINLQHVPFKGAGPALTDLLGGQVQGMIADFPVLYPHIRSGKLRGIVLTAEKRVSLLPELPTSAEEGLPDWSAVNWFAIMASARTSSRVVLKLHTSLRKSVNAPEIKKRFAALGVEPFLQGSPVLFREFLKDELVRWGKVAKASGARAD